MGMEVPVFGALPSQNLLCISLHLSVPFIIFFNKIVNVTVSLSSASLLSKLAEPVEGVMETSNCSQMEHKLWVTQEPSTSSWHLKWSKISLVGLYPYSIRIELNYSFTQLVSQICLMQGVGRGGVKPHTFGDQCQKKNHKWTVSCEEQKRHTGKKDTTGKNWVFLTQ